MPTSRAMWRTTQQEKFGRVGYQDMAFTDSAKKERMVNVVQVATTCFRCGLRLSRNVDHSVTELSFQMEYYVFHEQYKMCLQILLPLGMISQENASNSNMKFFMGYYWKESTFPQRVDRQPELSRWHGTGSFALTKPPWHLFLTFMPVMSNSRPACGPVEDFVRARLGFRCGKSTLHMTCPYFDDLEFDIFDGGGPQCPLSRLLPLQLRIRTLSVH